MAKTVRKAAPLAPFGPPSLIEGEDAAAYDELLTGMRKAVKPADLIEDMFVRDVVDLVWEILQLRRWKANLMMATAFQGLRCVLEPLIECAEVGQLVDDWARRKPYAVKRVGRILASAGLTIDAVMAQTLCHNLDDVERIDRMIAMAEARRNTVLREIDRHRATLGHALRQTVQQLEHDELQVIEGTKALEGKNAA